MYHKSITSRITWLIANVGADSCLFNQHYFSVSGVKVEDCRGLQAEEGKEEQRIAWGRVSFFLFFFSRRYRWWWESHLQQQVCLRGQCRSIRGREQALNLAVTLELLASSRSPSGLSALLRMRVSVEWSQSRAKSFTGSSQLLGDYP